ncbi:sensor histidine kinase [Aquimarina sp. 2201CG5-10]|uniref:ATP-binding protein n=1 Tax=Aquimarina callyspongiae TaxID=3098150 RepID=UPI002AB553CB|nr:sensor histidine kinase [Aquimarina sp. 2201CG5-10]MDY8136925.1 sensor histidine kinase [Aquimarina sp. 2201CG5-10]
MHIISARNFCILFLLISFSINAQEKKDWYTVFGKIPETIDKRLYNDLKNTKNLLQKVKVIDTIAAIHIQAGNTDSILYYGELLQNEVLAGKKELSNVDLYISKSHNILGKGKLSKGLFDDAMKHHLDGIAISPVSKMSKMYYTHQLGLGVVYLNQNEYDTAQSIFETCIQNTKDDEILFLAKKYLADVYFFTEETLKAKSYYLEVLDHLSSYPNNKTVLETQLKLGRIDAYQSYFNPALEYFIDVKEKARKNNFYDLYIEASIRVGIVYYKLDYLKDAEMILSSAYVNAVQWNKLELQRDVIMVLKDLKVANKDYENAYNLMTQYLSISNEILKDQNKKVVKELEIKYQTLQKEKEILSLKEEQLLKENEIDRQRTIKKAFLIGFLVVLIPVIGLLFLYFQKLKTQVALNKSQEEVNTQKVYGLMKDQELNLIKATMKGQDKERQRLARELHDSVGGNLASIKLQLSNANKTDVQRSSIIKQVDETYHQVRDFSHNLIPKKFQKNPITVLIKEYIDNVSNGGNQNISFHPYPEDEIDQIEPQLTEELFKIIQELLTNCLKHAKAKNIDIYLNKHEETIQLLFEDNGVGFETDKVTEGIGFKNIKNRLNALEGKIFVDSTPGRGTVIDIEIPVLSAVSS